MRDRCGPVLEVPSRAHEVSRLSIATAEIAVVEEEDRQSPAREPPGESGQPERTFRGKAVGHDDHRRLLPFRKVQRGGAPGPLAGEIRIDLFHLTGALRVKRTQSLEPKGIRLRNFFDSSSIRDISFSVSFNSLAITFCSAWLTLVAPGIATTVSP